MLFNAIILQAAAAPNVAAKGIERLFDTFVLFGVLGLLALGLMWIGWKLYIRIEALRDSHAAEIKQMNIEMRANSDRSIVLLEKAANLMTTFPVTTAEKVNSLISVTVQGQIDSFKRQIFAEIEHIKRLKCYDEKK